MFIPDHRAAVLRSIIGDTEGKFRTLQVVEDAPEEIRRELEELEVGIWCVKILLGPVRRP